jgi:hypothetical protein
LHGGEVSVGRGRKAATPGEVATPREATTSREAVPPAEAATAEHGASPVPAHETSAASDATPLVHEAAPTAPAATHERSATVDASCQNCGARLSGKYCAACGQRHEPHIHSLGEFIAEATESITHADSRVWRTLWALMVKPGFLTKEFLDGRRARYLPPFRLYLVLSVVFFLIAAAGSSHESVGLVGLTTGDGKPSLNVQKLEDMQAHPSETPEQRANRICSDFQFIGSKQGLVDGPALCRKIVGDNGHELVQALYHNIPRALILLLPLLALTMRLMYVRRHYVEHLLFFVHTHAFAFVFLAVYLLIVRFVPYKSVENIATLVMLLGLPYYTYCAMLRVYQQGKWLTRAKFSVLALSYFVLGVIMTVLLSLYTAVTL